MIYSFASPHPLMTTLHYYRIIFRDRELNGGWNLTDEPLFTRKLEAIERMRELQSENPRIRYRVTLA